MCHSGWESCVRPDALVKFCLILSMQLVTFVLHCTSVCSFERIIELMNCQTQKKYCCFTIAFQQNFTHICNI
jgi:hypothetical protein